MRVPTVSVVVPLYNKALYIRRSLGSVLNQTFTDFEAIVIDDGSTDGSGEIAGSLCDPRVLVVRQENGGEGAARNRGIAVARSGLIAFLDADDKWEAGFLEAIVVLAQTYPEAGWFATGYRRCMGTVWDRELTLRTVHAKQTRLIDNYLLVAREGDVVTSSSVAFRRKVLEETGMFPEKQPLGSDRDMWVRIGSRYALGFDVRILAVYHSDATGRAYDLADHQKPAIPPAINSLRRLLGDSALSARAREQAISYLDWLLFKHAAGMLYARNRETIESFLGATSFLTRGFRVRAALLGLALRWLPTRLLAALWLKPAAALWILRRNHVLRHLILAGEVLLGRTVVLSVRAATFD